MPNVVLKAATEGDLASVKECVQSNPLLLEVKDSNGLRPLHLASGKGHLEVVKYLKGAGAIVESKTKGGMTPLHRATPRGGEVPYEGRGKCWCD